MELAAHDPFFALHDVDSAIYDVWARRILSGGLPTTACCSWDRSTLLPGACTPWPSATPAAVKVVQCGLGVASVGLVGMVAREFFDRRDALAAAAIAAGYEMLIFYGGTLLVVNVQVPLVLLLVWMTARALRDPTPVRWLACGLLCGLCALARQTDLLFAPALLIGLFLLLRGVSAPQRSRDSPRCSPRASPCCCCRSRCTTTARAATSC